MSNHTLLCNHSTREVTSCTQAVTLQSPHSTGFEEQLKLISAIRRLWEAITSAQRSLPVYLHVFSQLQCSNKTLNFWVLTKLILYRQPHQTLSKSAVAEKDKASKQLELLCIASRSTNCFPPPYKLSVVIRNINVSLYSDKYT